MTVLPDKGGDSLKAPGICRSAGDNHTFHPRTCCSSNLGLWAIIPTHTPFFTVLRHRPQRWSGVGAPCLPPSSGHSRVLLGCQRLSVWAALGSRTHRWALRGPLTWPQPTCRAGIAMDVAVSPSRPRALSFSGRIPTGDASCLMTFLM